MFAIKLFFKDETRRAQIYSEENKISFAMLVSTAQSLFPALRGKSNLEFYWKDEEDDTIIVSSDDELSEATRVMTHWKRNVMRFEIRENQDGELLTSYPVPEATIASEINLAIHNHVRCDGCDVCPIVGVRYKCAVREDYDLCELCESKELQPHPMIKINNPDQAPAAIVIAVKEDSSNRGNWKGSHHRTHGPHGPHHNHHGHHDRLHPNGPFQNGQQNCRNTSMHPDGSWGEGNLGGPGPWRRMMRQERRSAENCGQGRNNWIAAATEALANSLSADGMTAFKHQSAEIDRADDATKTDQVWLEEALRQSLEGSALDAAASAGSRPNEAAAPVEESIAAAGTQAAAVIAVPALPLTKPMARFVRDVTFPDGTPVQPGSVFLKTWRIRNDGERAWPDNVVLACAGGDSLSSPDVILPVESLLPGCESEVTLQLSAPERTGRHVAYFRMRTTEGVSFGQRLWADIRVMEDDQGWHLLGGMLGTNVSSPSLSRSDSDNPAVVQEMKAESSELPTTASSTAEEHLSDDDSADITGTNKDEAENATEEMGESHNSLVAVWTKVWTQELNVLAEMGFTDTETNVTLLQKYLGIPSSLSSNGPVHTEGIQNVINALLSA